MVKVKTGVVLDVENRMQTLHVKTSDLRKILGKEKSGMGKMAGLKNENNP